MRSTYLQSITAGLSILALAHAAACGDDDDGGGIVNIAGTGGDAAGTGGTGAGTGGSDGAGTGGSGDGANGDGANGDGANGDGATGTACDPQGEGACQNRGDCPLVESGVVREAASSCGIGCLGDDDEATCSNECVIEETGVGAECAACYVEIVTCSRDNCLAECLADPDSDACFDCQVEAGCRAEFDECSGLPSPER